MVAVKKKKDWRATFADRRARNAGCTLTLQKKIWSWISCGERLLTEAVVAGDVDQSVRLMHVLNQLSGSYLRAAESQSTEPQGPPKRPVRAVKPVSRGSKNAART